METFRQQKKAGQMQNMQKSSERQIFWTNV